MLDSKCQYRLPEKKWGVKKIGRFFVFSGRGEQILNVNNFGMLRRNASLAGTAPGAGNDVGAEKTIRPEKIL